MDVVGLTPETITLINNITASLTPVAQHTYEVCVKQAYYNGIVNILFAFTIVIITFIVNFVLYRYGAFDDDDSRNFLFIMDGIIFGLFCMLLLTGVLRLINPEYYAIQMLSGRNGV